MPTSDFLRVPFFIPEMPHEFHIDFIAEACVLLCTIRAYIFTCPLYFRYIMRDDTKSSVKLRIDEMKVNTQYGKKENVEDEDSHGRSC